MQISELMTQNVISVRGEEKASLAARLLSRNNIGALPVCTAQGSVVGILTDRDLVTRCIAAGKAPEDTRVDEIMSRHVATADEKDSVETVMALMGREQVRRVPVTARGRLSGIVSLADLARQGQAGTEETLEAISSGVSRR